MTSAMPPVSASGRALHAMRADSRLSIDSWRPYVGIVGVLLGAIMSTLGTRVTTLGLADLRGGLHVGFDEGAWMTTSFGVGHAYRRRLSLFGRHLRRASSPSAWHRRFLHVEPARTGLTEFTSFFSDAVFVWGGFWNLHSPLNGVHRPKSAEAAHHLWCRDLRDEF